MPPKKRMDKTTNKGHKNVIKEGDQKKCEKSDKGYKKAIRKYKIT